MMASMRSGSSRGAPRPGETGALATAEPWLRSVAAGLLVVLALVLPFEVPLFRLGPLQITTVELALYATLGAWGLGVAADVLGGRARWRTALARLRRDDMVRASALWAAILLASAVVAPSDRAAALKFVLRSVSGILAFFAARSLGRSRGVGRSALLALVAGALLSAVTALVDWVWPGSAPAWNLFHGGTFDALGLRRASGVFEYPTIGAMYWEAAVPLVIAAPFAWRQDIGARRSLVAVLASGALSGAILASGTRTALVGAAIACALLAFSGRRSGRLVRRVAAGSLAVLVALSAAVLRPGLSDSPVGQRLRWWHDDRWFGAQYELPPAPRTVGGGEVFGVPVTLHNTGSIAWRSAGALPTRLSYHWYLLPDGGDPRLVDFEGNRTALPDDVPPGGAVQVIGVVRAPPARGTYRLSWDLVQENVTWFSERGSPVGDQTIDVRSASESLPAEILHAPSALASPSRASLWRAAVVLWREHPLLGVGPDNFRRRYEAVVPSSDGAPFADARIHANSLYFETLTDLGLAGVAGLAGLAVALLRALRRHWVSGCIPGLGCAVAALAFFVHGLLDYFFEFTPLYGLFWVALGLTAAFEPAPPA